MASSNQHCYAAFSPRPLASITPVLSFSNNNLSPRVRLGSCDSFFFLFFAYLRLRNTYALQIVDSIDQRYSRICETALSAARSKGEFRAEA